MIRSALKRRVRPKMGVRKSPQIRCPAHLAFVRDHHCLIEGKVGHVCEGIIEAMHVRTGTDGGTSVKPSDCFTVPGCTVAHRTQHDIGEAAFEYRYRINMRALADLLWTASPAGKRYRAEKDGEKR